MLHEPVTQVPGKVRSVVIVDDHPLYGDALTAALNLVFPAAEVRAARTLGAALDLIAQGFAPDLVMFDLKLPDVTGISGFQKLRDRIPDTPILVISSLTSVEVVEALMEEGAAGFLPKDASAQVLKLVLHEVGMGRKFVPNDYRRADPRGPAGALPCDKMASRLAGLTPQQTRIIRLICEGKANKQIAYELSLAEATVKAHITALLRRLGVQNRTQAAVLMETGQLGPITGPTDPDARAFLSH